MCIRDRSGIVGTTLRVLIRVELGIPGSFIGDDQIYNVIAVSYTHLDVYKRQYSGIKKYQCDVC